MRIVLEPHSVHVWYQTTEGVSLRMLEVSSAVLSADECLRRDRLRMPDDRRDFVMAHSLVRRALSRCADSKPGDWKFRQLPGGKPVVEGAPLSFSLSHGRGIVACAVASRPSIGIDVERISRAVDVRGLVAAYFHPTEVDMLDRVGADADTRFIELWTLKEAFLKASGIELMHSLRTASFAFAADETIVFRGQSDVDAGSWRFALLAPTPETRMSIAVEAAPAQQISVVVHHWGQSGTTPVAPIARIAATRHTAIHGLSSASRATH